MRDITIPQLIQEAHTTALDKGWWNEPRTVGEGLALVHSEVSEALEDYREGHVVQSIRREGGDRKPVGFAIELADVLIRIADMCGRYGIDLNEALEIKLEYNKTRPHRHGGKKL
jgi:NTP pyrophosphatase (non-canonical NTP hydrolase)